MHGNVHVYFIPICFCVIIISVGCINEDLNITWIQSYWNSIGRYKRQSACGPDQFTCTSGGCVLEDNECDGQIDCDDGSDEADCSNFRCASNLFQCSYGACIKKSFFCDGKKDCKDNSDEPSLCNNSATTKGPALCGIGEFQCSSGQCIDEELLCDGKSDCPDKSDETVKECGAIPCAAQIFFRCDYGACLPKSVKWNGVKDCIDGSDERGGPVGTTTEKPTPTPPIKKPPTPSPVTKKPTPPPTGSCLVPPNPANGQFKVGEENMKPGDYVPMFSALRLQCKSQFKPSPPTKGTYPLCLNGKWSLAPPSCARFCPPIQSSATTKIKCRFRGQPLDNCDDPIEGTIASLECEPLYEEPGISRNPNRVCKDGSWDYPIAQCLPVCGEKRPEGHTNVIGGQIAKQGDYPWHVGVYHKTEGHLCGGSIINQRVVLSAAHCFTDNYNGKLYPIENYQIAAGKYYRTYEDPRDIHAQYSDIDRIYVHERYRGTVNNYEADLAVIVLQSPFKIAVNVQPVCVDWNNDFEFKQLIENNVGIVVGWGYTTLGDKPSDELKEIQVPFKPYSDCVEQVPPAFQKFLTHDKICAGYLSQNKSVCQGDSGGGLTFEWNQNRYYIRGIVSTSPTTKETGIITCDANQYGTYTLISKHIDYIKDLEIQNRP